MKPTDAIGDVASIYTGDCREVLASLPNGSVQCCVTSPPYFGLRDYGMTGQLGLESTPDAYVVEMVAVFREVRRVLADDGTLWLNLGDSYNTSPPGNKNPMSKSGLNGAQTSEAYRARLEETQQRQQEHRGLVSGLKPKDLIGVPWRVAFALQQPYYSGRIKNEMDRVWLAAMIDAEGCLFIHKRKAGQHNGQGYYRQNDSYGPGLEVANTSEEVVRRCLEITGVGSICTQGPEENGRRKQLIYRWNLRTTECREVIREVYPHLVAKQRQARILCGCPASGERADAAHEALKILHRGGLTDVDFDAPESCYEGGYYLRQDIIWSKLNPMPESVRDRCTKAHEYLFLLSKRERYYFDAEAIAEQSVEWERTPNRPRVDPALRKGASHPKMIDGVSNCGVDITRNRRSVWTINPEPFPGAHFAVMPTALVEPCILAGSREGDTILDPFGGSGTVPMVAVRNNRRAVMIELNPAYVAMARPRIEHAAGKAPDQLLSLVEDES